MKRKLIFASFFLALFSFFSCGTDLTGSSSVIEAQNKNEGTSQKTEDESQKNDEEKSGQESQGGKSEKEEEDDDETIYEVTEDVAEIKEEEPPPEIHREWTVLVYMAADNNLESDAICDLNEMENSLLCDEVTILALFDRAQGYDATNGDWTGTRLYKVTKDEQMNKTLIASERLSCDELGLSSEYETELDMSKSSTLSGFLSFARKNFPADNYALFIWGHGTGWRNSDPLGLHASDDRDGGLSRAVAIESEGGTYMTISSLASAIDEGMDGEELSIIGFDTCFAMCIEAAYELKDRGMYMLGTPALVPESGWNYTKIFDTFCPSQRSVENLIEAIKSQYQQTYGSYAYASFSCVRLAKIGELVSEFSSYSRSLADSIDSKAKKDEIFEIISKETVSYCAPEYPTDFYFDMLDASVKLSSYVSGAALQKAFENALVCSWSASNSTASLGLFFCVYKTSSIIQSSHPANYINGSRDTLLSKFVSDCTGYVPGAENTGSLLDKLFYTVF